MGPTKNGTPVVSPKNDKLFELHFLCDNMYISDDVLTLKMVFCFVKIFIYIYRYTMLYPMPCPCHLQHIKRPSCFCVDFYHQETPVLLRASAAAHVLPERGKISGVFL